MGMLYVSPERPGVGAEADQCRMIQLDVGSQTLVLTIQEVFGAPDANGAVVRAGGQVLPVTAEIEARHVSAVALKSTRTQITHVLKAGCGEAA